MSNAGAPKGNKNAVKSKPWTDAIRRAIARRDAKEGCDGATLNKLADQLLEDCLNRDKFALDELTNRLDGKHPLPIVGDDERPPVQIGRIELVPMRGNSPD